ncbi:MAG TPA: indole-3-glycerol phosphate synthase TrpC [Chloroflexota bacterium]|nr:indole-3-glycerol phosphate synthase TrpC [Chloroflexota bacterium]
MDTLQPVASDFLSRILRDKEAEVAAAKAALPHAVMEERARAAPPPLPALAALRGERLRVIAEVKRASPSAGVFAGGLDAASQGRRYAAGGAAAISVLTDGPYFQGSLADLEAARKAVSIPLLRKDFIIDPYQVHEARAAGADLVLLIVAALSAARLTELLRVTTDLGMGALVEVCTEDEARLARDLDAPLVGINNRNLRAFTVDMETTARLRPLLAPRTVVASLSGIKTVEDARAMRATGVDAVLVGEALARAAEPECLLAELAGLP